MIFLCKKNLDSLSYWREFREEDKILEYGFSSDLCQNQFLFQ